jgi:hypothetical protein
MRGLRGRHRRSSAIAAVLGLLVLASSTAVVVALTRHRPPPAVVVGTRPLTAAPGEVARAGQAATPVSGPSAAADITPAPPPSSAPRRPATVRIDENTGSVSVPVGTRLEVRLHGTPTDRWREPELSGAPVLRRLSASATPDGDAAATFEAVAAGDALIVVERSTTCSSGPSGGVCAVAARRISVSVTG